MTHQIALITDSTCDIPAEWIKKYEITIVPLTIIFGDEQYLDGVELTAEQFYQRLPNAQHHPTTSQPTPQAFLEAYRQVAADGAREILVITISSAMSGTLESARIAAEGFTIPVHTIDSRNHSMGLGWQVIAAARAREEGGDLEAMQAAAEKIRKSVVYYISLDTIEYLSKGGRISEAVRFLDSVLNIKPIVYANPQSGTIGASIPARSRKSALEGLYKEFFRHVNTTLPMHIAVLHNNALEEAQNLAERVLHEFYPKELFISIASPVLGVHSGPGSIALCGYAES